MFAVSC